MSGVAGPHAFSGSRSFASAGVSGSPVTFFSPIAFAAWIAYHDENPSLAQRSARKLPSNQAWAASWRITNGSA